MSPVTVNRINFEDCVKSGPKPALIEFRASWCPYCRRIDPAMEQIASLYDGQLLVGQVDYDGEPALAERFEVDTIPTLIFFRGGQALGRTVAPGSREEIEAFIAAQRKP